MIRNSQLIINHDSRILKKPWKEQETRCQYQCQHGDEWIGWPGKPEAHFPQAPLHWQILKLIKHPKRLIFNFDPSKTRANEDPIAPAPFILGLFFSLVICHFGGPKLVQKLTKICANIISGENFDVLSCTSGFIFSGQRFWFMPVLSPVTWLCLHTCAASTH